MRQTGHRHLIRSTAALALTLFLGLTVFAFSIIALVYSNLQCPPTSAVVDDPTPVENRAKAKIAGEKTADEIFEASGLRTAAGPRSPFRIVPESCDSPFRDKFDKIYSSGIWFKGKGLRHPSDFYGEAEWPPREIVQKSASGWGSDRGYATTASLKIIKDVILKYDVKSMIDIPCGDVNWIFDSYVTDTLPVYIGLDISIMVNWINQQRFSHHNNKLFASWDATSCALPKFVNETTGHDQSVDLVHVRDVIQHMTLDMGVKYFCNVFESGAKVLITTTFPGPRRNAGAKEGGFYDNNLELEPFSFPPGEDCVETHPKVEGDLTCVYDLRGDWVKEFVSSKC